MAILSHLSLDRKLRVLVDAIPKSCRVLEIGCGAGEVREYMLSHGWRDYTGLDLRPPADIVGDIRDWQRLGLHPESFDALIAFEVVEHVDCWQAMYDLLKPDGVLMVTTPIPSRDWICRLLERAGLAQKRTSPHDHLVDLRRVPKFELHSLERVGWLAQWGIFHKPFPGGGEEGQ
jgi:cyclopropane fatty-acyl-phospholipid synthase-like methyltransferase